MLVVSLCVFVFQRASHIDMNRQSDIMSTFEEQLWCLLNPLNVTGLSAWARKTLYKVLKQFKWSIWPWLSNGNDGRCETPWPALLEVAYFVCVDCNTHSLFIRARWKPEPVKRKKTSVYHFSVQIIVITRDHARGSSVTSSSSIEWTPTSNFSNREN